jgi:hypothetical protein
MLPKTNALYLLLIVSLFLLALPVQAGDDSTPSAKVIYQTTFSSDPHWTTNSPSSDYWDPSAGRYHFKIEPSTGNYAYTTIPNLNGPFTFEYDVILDRIDDGATFRFGLTGTERDFNKGSNIFSMFSNKKHGQIMWLHTVTVGSKLMEVNSQSDDQLTSGPLAYKGPTVKFELNKTYQVTTSYDDTTGTVTMRVRDKATGKEIWSYFIKTVENFRDMNSIYLGSRGDYGSMYTYASGYIDNVRLTQPGSAVNQEPTPEYTETQETPQAPTKALTTRPTVPTPFPTETPQSPLGSLNAVLALGIIGTICTLCGRKND